MKWFETLKGWKTYFLGVGAIITAIGSFLAGAIDLNALVAAIFAALGLMGLRHGITTTVSEAVNKKL